MQILLFSIKKYAGTFQLKAMVGTEWKSSKTNDYKNVYESSNIVWKLKLLKYKVKEDKLYKPIYALE